MMSRSYVQRFFSRLLFSSLALLLLSCSEDEVTTGGNSDPTSEPVLPTVTTSAISTIRESEATGGGTVNDDGGATVTQRGLVWGTQSNPTTSDKRTSSGAGEGSFSASLTNLEPNTTYFVRAYAVNEVGTAYGDEVSFTTLAAIDLPVVITDPITEITLENALSGGNVTDDGGGTITSRGVCWSTTDPPTIDDSKTEDGSGTGTFTSNITSLESSTTYYLRAYATNEKGTAYGETLEFTTADQSTVTDASGYVYKTVRIGNQLWMATGLRTYRYRNGEAISSVSVSLFPTQTAYGRFARIPLPPTASNFDSLYGVFYNYKAILDPQGICPEGWHVPTNQDWDDLVEYLGGADVAGQKMKADTLWKWPTGTNTSGFAANPGGLIGGGNIGTHSNFYEYVAFYGINDEFNPPGISKINIQNDRNSVYMSGISTAPPTTGHFCRCLKD